MAKLHLPGTSQDHDSLVYHRLVKAGSRVSYPARVPEELLRQLGFDSQREQKALQNDVFNALRRLEAAGWIVRSTRITREAKREQGYLQPASREKTIEALPVPCKPEPKLAKPPRTRASMAF